MAAAFHDRSMVISCTPSGRQRGAATLAVVMVLFFIIAMVAAYTSRNLIFEQRTSANQYRSTQAFEAADAGIEWTLAMLNSGRIDDACQPTTDVTQSTFRARYIDGIDATGQITLRTQSTAAPGAPAGAPLPRLMPACVFDESTTQWKCRCPSDGGPSVPSSVTSAAARPMFRIRFDFIPVPVGAPPSRHDVLRIVSAGCTRPDAACLAEIPGAPAGDALAVVTALVALKSALPTIPGAAITARGAVNAGTGALQVTNVDRVSNGMTVIAGGDITGNIVASTLPGTPSSGSLARNDGVLQSLPAPVQDRMFGAYLGMDPAGYSSQPAAVTIDCSATCNAATVNQAAQRNPGRMLWLNGDVLVDGNIGTALNAVTPPSAETLLAAQVPPSGPVLMVVNGTTTLASGTVFGVIYGRTATWDRGTGNTVVRGALVAEGQFGGSGSQAVVYDPDILTRLHTRHGSFVRIPGGWKDFADAP